jgi:hypothetical protein
MEEVAPKEYFAGGKMRKLDRSRWWTRYQSDKLTVFGHYWRRFPRPASTPCSLEGLQPSGADPFIDSAAGELLGPKRSAMCVDFSAGVRYEERGKGLRPGGLGTALGALRLPELTIHLDDGAVLGPLEREGPSKRQKK